MRRTTVNLTEATDRQIEYLKERGFGSFTQIVRMAIDRMYREGGETMDSRELLQLLEEALESEIRTLTYKGKVVALATGGDSGDETDHADVIILDTEAIKGLALCEICEEFYPSDQIRETWELEWEALDPGPQSSTRGNVHALLLAKRSRGASFTICPSCIEERESQQEAAGFEVFWD